MNYESDTWATDDDGQSTNFSIKTQGQTHRDPIDGSIILYLLPDPIIASCACSIF